MGALGGAKAESVPSVSSSGSRAHLAEVIGVQSVEIREHLASEGLVNLEDVDVAEGQAHLKSSHVVLRKEHTSGVPSSGR